MLDTVVLSIPEKSFSILNHHRFNPSTFNLFQPSFYRLGARSNFSCKQNPTKSELRNGYYKPRLTVTKRMKNNMFQITLRIEFSVPKLLFGNNFDEVEETDFPVVISLLREKLSEMGVLISDKVLSDADVSAVHFSKNIPLTDYLTPSWILKELSKLNLNEKLDLNQTDFRNEGHCLKFHCNSYEIVFYDKRKDINKAKVSEKRSIEENNSIQFDLFRDKNFIKPFEVLRIEIRLNNRTKLKQSFKKIDVTNDLMFSSIFKKYLSQKILLYFFKIINEDYSLLTYKPKNTKDLFFDLRISNPDLKIKKLLQMFGLKIALEEMGIREFRESISQFGNNNWYRLKKELSLLKLPLNKSNMIKSIEEDLINFQTLKLSNFLKD